ncbi:hypothetical protein HPB51_012080 [Rhipicephalus microplus]|uniref:Uncharacterized protein n=1 Tax=Rhipicephalus microplus TaxID=6941 RepID=A0A9J6D9Y1_RHIMP|nr:hypothetical protein HPB51_012080 [Rhipicephalus microplus]
MKLYGHTDNHKSDKSFHDAEILSTKNRGLAAKAEKNFRFNGPFCGFKQRYDVRHSRNDAFVRPRTVENGVQSRTTNAASLNFSRLLHETDAGVFESAESVLQVLRLADERFRGNDVIPPLTTPCSGDGGDSRCWALNYQRRWNQLLNRRGIELIELPENAFFCLTFGNTPEVLQTPEDIQTLTVCLWLFREHQCVRGVNMAAYVVAPHNSALFWRLFQLSKHVTAVELRDVQNNVDSLSIRRLFRGRAEQLTELVLADFFLYEKDARDLAALLSCNKSLSRLALINLNIKEHSLDSIVAKIKDHGTLKEVELTESRKPIASHTIAYLLQSRVLKLRLNVDCAWEAVSTILAKNVTLAQLTIISRSTFHSALGPLARAVATRETLQNLVLVLDPSWAEANESHFDWEDLIAIVTQCRALRKLRISVPSLGDAAARAISEAIGINRSLHELHFDGCVIPCYSAVVLLEGLLRNWTLRLLSLMNTEGDDAEHQHLLRFMLKNSLCHRVSVRYEGCQAKLLDEAMRNSEIQFPNFNFFCKYAPDANIVFEALPCVKDSLTTLSIDSNEDLFDAGAESLARLFSDSEILKNVVLDFPATPDTCVILLQGLAQSRSITSVSLIGWKIGRPSKFKNHPDFVPSVFTYVRSRGDAAVRRHSRWWKRQKGELDTTATSATPNDTPELQDPPNENLNMDTSAAQDGVLDENSVDLQQLENENPDEGLDATKDDVPDQDSMELQQPENGIKEHIWPDCRCQACASKKIEVAHVSQSMQIGTGGCQLIPQ